MKWVDAFMKMVDALMKMVDALRLSTLCSWEQAMTKVDALRLSTLRFDILGNKEEDV